MSEPVESMTVTWDAVLPAQVLTAVNGQLFPNGCMDCSGAGTFALSVGGWRLYVEHDEGCVVLARRRAEVATGSAERPGVTCGDLGTSDPSPPFLSAEDTEVGGAG